MGSIFIEILEAKVLNAIYPMAYRKVVPIRPVTKLLGAF